MNARKGRPARRITRRWPTWGCALAMGVAAAPLNTLLLAYSQPLAELHEPREWTAPENEVTPLPTGDSSWGDTRPDIRHRMISALGLTAVEENAPGVCRTPGEPARRGDTPAYVLDGFRAKAAAVAARVSSSDERKSPEPARRQISSVKSGQAGPAPQRPRALHPKPDEKHRPRVTRVTPVDSAQIVPLQAVQADFQLDPVDPPLAATAGAATPRVWEDTDRPAIENSRPPRPPARQPDLRAPVFGGLSDEENPAASPEGSAEGIRGPGAGPERVRDEVGDSEQPLVTRAGISDRVIVRSGVSDEPLLVATGASDEQPARAGLSDEPAPAYAGVSDEPAPAYAGVSDEPTPTYAGVSDDETQDIAANERAHSAELLLMPAMEVAPPRKPEQAGLSDLEVEPEIGGELEAFAGPFVPSDVDEPAPLDLAGSVPDPARDDQDDSAADSESRPYYEEPSPFSLSPAQPRELSRLNLTPSQGTDHQPEDELVDVEQIGELARGEEAEEFMPQAGMERAESRAIYGVSDLDDQFGDTESSADPLMRLDLTSSAAMGRSTKGVSAAGIRTGEQSDARLASRPREASLPADRKLDVQLRQGKLVRTAGEIVRTEVVDPGICEVVQFEPNELSIIGKRSGQTQVRVWLQGDSETDSTNYLINVGDAPERRQAEAHAQLVESLAERYPQAELELKTFGDRVIVQGAVRSNQEAIDILSRVRKVWLVPVEDRLVVKR